jgi:hypothetical protein
MIKINIYYEFKSSKIKIKSSDSYIDVIRLPRKSQWSELFVGEWVTIIGWGSTTTIGK